MEDDSFSGFELDDDLVVTDDNLESIRLINRNYWNYYFYAIDRYGQKGLSGIACHKNHAIEIMKVGDKLYDKIVVEDAKLFDIYSALFIMYYYCGIKIDGRMKKKADVYSFFMGELDDDSREEYCKRHHFPSPKEIFIKINLCSAGAGEDAFMR